MLNTEYRHPGEVITKEFLEPFDISSCELSKSTFMPLTKVDGVLKGYAKINADIALRLGKFFGNSAKFWLWLQIDYDIAAEQESNHGEINKIKSIDQIEAA